MVGGSKRDGGGHSGAEVVWAIVGYLLAGVIAWGGIGMLLDRRLGTVLFLPIGVLVGFAGAFYLIVRRYGSGG